VEQFSYFICGIYVLKFKLNYEHEKVGEFEAQQVVRMQMSCASPEFETEASLPVTGSREIM
jgi:hypothetical protein